MKKLLFLLPVLVFVLSYCSKQQSDELLPQTDTSASERAICNIVIGGDSDFELCGTVAPGSGTVCNACTTGGANSLVHYGTQAFPAGTWGLTINAPTPHYISIRNTGAQPGNYKIGAGSNQVNITLAPGDCEELQLDASCFITVM